jgi:transcription termination/antitermination protein NusG
MPRAKKQVEIEEDVVEKTEEEIAVDAAAVAANEAKLEEANGGKFGWYIVNTYSGHENKAANQIRQRIIANGMEDVIPEVVVPTQEKIVAVGGKKRTVKERLFPGYVLVRMIMNDNAWHLIRNTDGVVGFVGFGKRPTPLNEKEVKAIITFMDVKQPSYQSSFKIGDAVKVVDGPFKDFVGSVKEINEDKGQVTVLLSIFGRETPVYLDFLQVNKL